MTRASSLRVVPTVAPRALGMIRVSDEDGRGEDLLSPEIQRVAIRDYCARQGYQVTGWLEGIDESGSRAKSKWWAKLDQAIGGVEAREVDVVVVWKFSRAARQRLKWAMALERIEVAGGRLESATEGFDTTTSAGQFARGMLGELAVFEAKRIGEGWKETHASRVRGGRPHTGKPKWGYVYDRAAKLHVPATAENIERLGLDGEAETGPVLADLYRRYVAGESFYALVHWLNGRGYRTLQGGQWGTETLRRVLDSGFASGRFMSHGALVDGVHEALIDEETWQAYLDARHRRREQPPKAERSRYVLSGLVRCGECGGPMTAGTYGRHAHFRCETRYTKSLALCSTKYVRIDLIEGLLLEELQGLADGVDEAARSVVLVEGQRTSRAAEVERLGREVVRVEAALHRLAVQNATTPLPESVYDAAVRDLAEQLARLQAAQAESERELRGLVEDPARVAAGLLEAWHKWPVEHRRSVLRDLLVRLKVYAEDDGVRVVPVWVWEAT